MIPSWDMRNQSKLHFLTDVPGECYNRLPHRYYCVCGGEGGGRGGFPLCLNGVLRSENDTSVFMVRHRAFT